ncbi:MAG: chloramphenicol acetyltransferase [Acidobacteriota bacterium]
MATYLDLDAWPRREHFDFFRRFDNPFWNVCVPLDVTALKRYTDDEKRSFLVTSHFLAMQAANRVESFRYRVRGDRVLIHDRVSIGTIVLKADDSFTFVYFDHTDDFESFHRDALAEIERVKANADALDARAEQDDMLHCSVLPWLRFTSISHARRWNTDDSVPKLSFGKLGTDGDRLTMPVSIEVHHALMDGLHVGRFVEILEGFCADPAMAMRSAGSR